MSPDCYFPAMAELSPTAMSDRQLRLMNPVMRQLIKRGVGSLSREMMVVNWNGRKSGQSLWTPVSRFDGKGGSVYTTTPSGWRHNFADPWPAQLQLGRDLTPVTGVLVSDPGAVADRMLGVIDELGMKRGPRNLGIEMSDRPSREELVDFCGETGWSVIDFSPQLG